MYMRSAVFDRRVVLGFGYLTEGPKDECVVLKGVYSSHHMIEIKSKDAVDYSLRNSYCQQQSPTITIRAILVFPLSTSW